jgi:hypothetical protein
MLSAVDQITGGKGSNFFLFIDRLTLAAGKISTMVSSDASELWTCTRSDELPKFHGRRANCKNEKY